MRRGRAECNFAGTVRISCSISEFLDESCKAISPADTAVASRYILNDRSETCLVVDMIACGVMPCKNMKVQKPARPE